MELAQQVSQAEDRTTQHGCAHLFIPPPSSPIVIARGLARKSSAQPLALRHCCPPCKWLNYVLPSWRFRASYAWLPTESSLGDV
eukprot:1751494-Amphidinium_carterae.1